MKTATRLMAAFALGAPLFSAVSFSQTSLYSVQELSFLPGYTAAEGISINDRGTVVGVMVPRSNYPGCESNCAATIWVNGTPTLLGVLPGTTGAVPVSINNTGQVVGYAFGTKGEEAVIWNNGKPTLLPSPYPQYPQTTASFVNDAGQVVGYVETNTGETALVWNDLTPTVLSLGGNDFGQASGINASGLIVGNIQNAPIVWHGTQPTRLPVDPGFAGGQAFAVNNSGIVVGATRAEGGLYSARAAAWADGGMTDLGSLNGQSAANAINNRGIIVGKSFTATGGSHAVLWGNIGSPIQDLNKWISATDSDAYILQYAFAVNDSCTIVAYGFSRATPSHTPASVLLTLNDPSMCVNGL